MTEPTETEVATRFARIAMAEALRPLHQRAQRDLAAAPPGARPFTMAYAEPIRRALEHVERLAAIPPTPGTTQTTGAAPRAPQETGR